LPALWAISIRPRARCNGSPTSCGKELIDFLTLVSIDLAEVQVAQGRHAEAVGGLLATEGRVEADPEPPMATKE
jgi:hypothetical protein